LRESPTEFSSRNREAAVPEMLVSMQKVEPGKVARHLGTVDADAPAVGETPACDSALDQLGPMVAILNAGGGAAPMSAIEHPNRIEHLHAVFARQAHIEFLILPVPH